jgi:hypothetical protein
MYPEYFRQKKLLSFVFIAFLLISFFIHTKGALSSSNRFDEYQGNKENDSNNTWNWKEVPFLR